MDKSIKLAIFDLDGTLFDTADVNYYSYKSVLESYGIELDHDYFVTKCNGKHYSEFLPQIMGSMEHVEEVHTAKKNVYAHYLSKAKINYHLFDIINLIKCDYKISIVTTASYQNTADILTHFGYYNLFDYIISQENISIPKPNPQGFLLAMNHFNVDAAHTIIFEDSDIGIRAAKLTGATVFVVNQIYS